MATKNTKSSNLVGRISDITAEPQSTSTPTEEFTAASIMPLEEAIEPLVKIVQDIQRRAKSAKRHCKHPLDGLTPDESASIVLYTAEWEPYDNSLYYILNNTLRTRDTEQLKPWFPYLKLMTTALRRLPPIGNRTVYRGVRLDLSHLYPQGKTFVWWGFSSCTTSMNILEEEHFFGKHQARTLFAIESFSGRDIHQHSSIETENEVLLLAATQFTVVACLDQGPDLHIIQLKEVAPLHPLFEAFPDDHAQAAAPQKNKQQSKFSFARKISLLSTKMSSEEHGAYENTKLTKLIDKHEAHSLINLERQSLTDQDIPMVIQQAMVEKQCTMLRLSNNEIKSHGVSLLADALHNNTTLMGLYIFGNKVTDQGVISLTRVLSMKDSTLKALSLGGNDITDEGAGHLANMLRTNTTLIDLCLPCNHISDHGVQLLANALIHDNKSLKRLSLDLNKLVSDSSIDTLVDVINQNQSLAAVSVVDCKLSNAGKTRLRDAAKLQKNLKLQL